MRNERFEDRTSAGRALAAERGAYKGPEDVVVHALRRGGVRVGFEVGKHLGVPLDVMVVPKLGVTDHEEVAKGTSPDPSSPPAAIAGFGLGRAPEWDRR